LGKTIKSPRNSWDSWGIPGGFLEELTLVQKYYKIQNYPRIVQELLLLEIVVYGYRDRYFFI
jgi:hypothetical protein